MRPGGRSTYFEQRFRGLAQFGLDLLCSSRDREAAEVCASEGVMYPVADLFHRADDLVERDEMVVTGESHIGT